MNIILKVMRKQANSDDMYVYRNEDRKIQFQRKPTSKEREAMSHAILLTEGQTDDKFFGEFELSGGRSTFLRTTKSRDW